VGFFHLVNPPKVPVSGVFIILEFFKKYAEILVVLWTTVKDRSETKERSYILLEREESV
jgi:hypothetical protein